MRFMYSSGFWILSGAAKQLGLWLLVFLNEYAACVRLSLDAGLNRFSLVPKIHMIHHTALQVTQEASRAKFAKNPLAHSVQCQEDYIGRGARISRRVNARRLHENTLARSLIAVLQALQSSDLDDRGLTGPV